MICVAAGSANSTVRTLACMRQVQYHQSWISTRKLRVLIQSQGTMQAVERLHSL